MKKEDRVAIRAFYQTLADPSQGAITEDQVEFYTKVLKGNAKSRKIWAQENAGKMNIPTNMLILVQNIDTIDKTDLAIILASQVAAAAAPEVQKITKGIMGWKLWPWNW